MRIAVSVKEPSLDADLEPRFGRCPCFLIVETDDLTFEAVENPHVSLGSGAGIQSAQLMAEKGVEFVLTGNCGPNAYQTLTTAGIKVIVGCSGVARRVVEQFKTGQLSAISEPNVVGHSGMGTTSANNETGAPVPPGQNAVTGMGPGAGLGRGGGRGRGRGGGMGRGRGRCMQTWPPAPMPAEYCQGPRNQSEVQEIDLLKQEAKEMGQRLLEIGVRIRQLEEEGQPGAGE